MRNLYLSEFKKHLETGHLRTRFEYFEPRAIAPDVAWGSIENEIITNGSSFRHFALFYHMKGDMSRIEVHPLLEGSLGDKISFNILSEDGDDADQDDIERAVLDVRPDMLVFDSSILGSERLGVVCIVDSDAPRTYCIQIAQRPDMVFDGVIRSWDYITQTWSNWTRWINRIKYATSQGTIVTLREHTLFHGRKRIRTKRWAGEFRCPAEADAWLYGYNSVTRANRLQKEGPLAPTPFCPFGRTDRAARERIYISASTQTQHG